jgi:predicted DNA-binding transcriptional regulator AlpA
MASATVLVAVHSRGLGRVRAAAYVGVSPGKFDEMVADGRMPRPKEIDRRLVWDVRELDTAFDELPVRRGERSGVRDDSWTDFK